MDTDATFVFALLAVAAILFASNRVRLDLVALMVVLALMLSGVLTPAQSVAGFGNSIVLLVAGLLVVGEMLARTGIAHRISGWILSVGGDSETRLTVLLMLTACLLSGVMSSTAVVAIFIPIVLDIADKKGLHRARLLMPVSFAALIGGMLTLIATTPNLVVSEALEYAGHAPFQFFSFAPIGLAVLAAAVAYLLLVGRRLIPTPTAAPEATKATTIDELGRTFEITRMAFIARITGGSPLVGKSLTDAEIGRRYDVRVLAIERRGRGGRRTVVAIGPDLELHADDELVVLATEEGLQALATQEQLETRYVRRVDQRQILQEIGLAVVLVHPDSTMVGKSIRESRVRSRYGVHVLALRRAGAGVADFTDASLKPGDALLITSTWDRIRKLTKDRHDFIVTTVPAEMRDVAPAQRKAPIAVMILAAMVALSVFQVVPILTAVLLAAVAAVLTRCLTMEDAYRSIHWSSIVLVAGMLPLATAMDVTGGIDLIVEAIERTLGSAGPYAIMSVLFWITALLGLVLSNTATSVVMAPIAISSAAALDVSPYPIAMAIVIAASAGFASPVSSPVVTLVVEPGRYRFIDFVKVGLPLMVITFLVAIVTIPLLFPFEVAATG